ncbi:hypothetical protein B0H17DRAFT_1265294, partial [Mycena rosella]
VPVHVSSTSARTSERRVRDLRTPREAAEKYLVFSALPITKVRMRNSVAEHPLEVLDYAARHDHGKLATEKRLSMGLPVPQAVRILAPDTLLKWVRMNDCQGPRGLTFLRQAVFYDKWHATQRAMFKKSLGAIPGNQVYHYDEIRELAICLGDRNPGQNHRRREKMERFFQAKKWSGRQFETH